MPTDASVSLLLASMSHYEDGASRFWVEDAGLASVVSYLLQSSNLDVPPELYSALDLEGLGIQ